MPRLDDPARLTALRRTALLDHGGDAALDRPAALTARVLRAEAASVSLLDDRRHVAAGAHGLGEGLRELPLDASLCRPVVECGEALVVGDTREHPLLRDSPAALRGVRAYAAVPLQVGGVPLGALCVFGRRPRAWTAGDVDSRSTTSGPSIRRSRACATSPCRR